MSNEHLRDLQVLYLLGELTVDEKHAFESHLRGCPDCREELDRLRRTDILLREWAVSTREEQYGCPCEPRKRGYGQRER